DLNIKTHGLLGTYPLMLTVGHALQLSWYRKMDVGVPDSVEKNYTAHMQKHEKEIADLKKGKVKAKKNGAEPQSPEAMKAKEQKKSVSFSNLKSKVESSRYSDKVKDPKVASHLPLVAQVLLSKADKSWPLGDIVDAVKATKRYSIKGSVPIEQCVKS